MDSSGLYVGKTEFHPYDDKLRAYDTQSPPGVPLQPLAPTHTAP